MWSNRWSSTALIAAAGLIAAGCSDATGPRTGAPVRVAFASVSHAGGSPLGAEGMSGTLVQGQSLSMAGTNGVLAIEELRVIVERFRLDRQNDDDCDGLVNDDPCERFQTGPIFVNVPLDGGQVVAVTAQVAPDSYDRLRFEIDDLDDDSPADMQLLSEIRAQFPGWPRDASMLVVGTFTPTSGAPVPFQVYFEAEVEIRLDLVPPVTITEGGQAGTFTVVIDPAFWFRRPDGTVRNLAALDHGATGSVVEFEVEVRNGFVKVEFDD